MMYSRFHRNGGFSIVELVVSVAILGLLASVAMPVIQTTITHEKEYQLTIALRDIRNAIDAYKQASASGLITPPQPSGYPPNLLALYAGVATNPANGQQSVQIYFLRNMPRDPFFPDQTTPAVNTWGLRSFEMAPDTQAPGNHVEDVFDVYSMSTQVGLNGIAYSLW